MTRNDPRSPGDPVSPVSVNRLSLYLRSLHQLRSVGIERVSSAALAGFCRLSAAQVRKDLSAFGGFGTRGVGYDIEPLARHLVRVLRLDRLHRLVIFGMGNIGTALARYPPFNDGSFRVVAGFDADPRKIGTRVAEVPVHSPVDLPRVVKRSRASMAVLAVPVEAAATGYEALVGAGIRAILNFAPIVLPTAPGCRVKNVDLRTHLEELAFFGAPDDRD
ncbi:MAG: redox-sensing transcriptional repressor Rex [Thermoanaerobaculia bacterium]